MEILNQRVQLKEHISIADKLRVYKLSTLVKNCETNFKKLKRKGKREAVKKQRLYLLQLLSQLAVPIKKNFKNKDIKALNTILEKSGMLKPTDEKSDLNAVKLTLAWIAARCGITQKQLAEDCTDEDIIQLYLQIRLKELTDAVTLIQAKNPTEEYATMLDREIYKITQRVRQFSIPKSTQQIEQKEKTKKPGKIIQFNSMRLHRV